MLDLKIFDAAAFGGPKRTYDSANNRILIRVDLKNTVQDTELFAEEVGSALDNRLNTSDTAGDEGEFFRMLLSGQTLST